MVNMVDALLVMIISMLIISLDSGIAGIVLMDILVMEQIKNCANLGHLVNREIVISVIETNMLILSLVLIIVEIVQETVDAME